MQLVDEEDDLAVTVFDLLEAVLELAAKLGPGDHAGEVEGDEAHQLFQIWDLSHDSSVGRCEVLDSYQEDVVEAGIYKVKRVGICCEVLGQVLLGYSLRFHRVATSILDIMSSFED